MNHVFLSYRHVEPDERLAEGLCAYLEKHGLRVFFDKKIRVGLRFAEKIDRELRASDSFVIFLSESSILSDMVRQEVRIAHELRLNIFPVLVGFRGKLPYDLGSYLNPIQYARWEPGDSETELLRSFSLRSRMLPLSRALRLRETQESLPSRTPR